MTPNEQRMMQVIDENREKVHKIAKKIWEFKEVGWEEFQSSALLENALEKEGFEVQRGLVGKHRHAHRLQGCVQGQGGRPRHRPHAGI